MVVFLDLNKDVESAISKTHYLCDHFERFFFFFFYVKIFLNLGNLNCNSGSESVIFTVRVQGMSSTDMSETFSPLPSLIMCLDLC